ncbi:ArsR/SmtB family transcription factor [Lentzea sp. NPDC051213]|uniref:ArsR/SmtB family transcription factor n=1 Tax=Lentzea sp. NPDC051213 TaxID=3364126 RepID=UPI0037B9D7D6
MEERQDAVALLLGKARAAVLRLVDGSPTMGELAARARIARSVTSYHCEVLEEAGLLVRERQGKSVRVHRTSRGTALLALLSAHFNNSRKDCTGRVS